MFSTLQVFIKSQGLWELERSGKISRPTNDSVASWQDSVNYPIKQDSIWEKSGHDLSHKATKSSSLRREIRTV